MARAIALLPLPTLSSLALSLPALLATLTAAHAVTLGGYEVQSSLGQALRMVVQVSARPDEDVDASCFRINPFSVAGDGLPQLTTAQLTFDQRAGQRRLVISSSRAIMDPIVRIAIDVGCDTTLRREITLLLDPPPAVESLPQVAAARPAGVPIPAPGGTTTPSPDASRSGAGSAAMPGGAPGASPRASAEQTSPRPRAETAAPRAPAPARAPAPSPVPQRAAPSTEPAAPLAQAPDRPPARPPRALPSARPQVQKQPPSAPLPPVRVSRDRLSISSSPLPLESTGATLTPRLNLAMSLGDRGRQPMSDNAKSMLKQKQDRLRAAPAGEDLPSLEAEVVVLHKRTSEMQRQLDAVIAQMAAMKASSAAAGASSGASSRSGAPAAGASTPTTAPAASLAPTIATAPVKAPSPAAAPATAPKEIEEVTPVKTGPIKPPSRWSGLWNDQRLWVAVPLGIALLLLILGFIFWLRRERDDAQRADRWTFQSVSGEPLHPIPPSSFEREVTPDPQLTMPVMPIRDNALPSEPKGAPAQDMPFKTYSGQAAQELGVSDLAQATEKASVFVTLGRPAQAIDVLRDHIDHEPKSSPMAWLMLLDLYRQTNRRDDFSEVAQRFHLEYNAVTPEWIQAPAPLHEGGLAEFPYLIANIRDEWPTVTARTFIEELLYDNRGGSRIGFSIPAFRDLLLLHSMIDEYVAATDKRGRIDPATGRIIDAPEPPKPPSHLAAIWKTASPERPAYKTPLPGSSQLPSIDMVSPFEMAAIAESPDRSALEKSYPIIAEAIVNRWAQAGLAPYLSNLIRSSSDRGAGLTNDALAELILLHDIAVDLGEPEPTFTVA